MSGGVATIVFTDVEGSTALAGAVGDERAKELIEQQRAIVHELVEAGAGRVIDTAGDGFMLAFDSPRAALTFARDVEDALAERGGGVRVRIGIHTGEVLEKDGHPFGTGVVVAARVSARARGGQVLLSNTVRELSGNLPGLRFRDRGNVKLKGFDESWRIYELDWENRRPMPALLARSPRRGPPIWALGAVLAATVGAIAWAAWPSAPRSLPVIPNSVAAVDPKSGRVLAVVPVGTHPAHLAVAGNDIWTGNVRDRTMTLIDAGTRSAVKTIGVDVSPRAIAAVGDGNAWVTDGVRFAPVSATNGVGETRSWIHTRDHFGGGFPGSALAVHHGYVWVAFYTMLQRAPLDGAAPDLVTTDLDGSPTALLWRGDTLWIGDSYGNIDAFAPSRSTAQHQIVSKTGSENFGGGAGAVVTDLAEAGGFLWPTDAAESQVVRFDPTSFGVKRIDVGNRPQGIAAAGKAVWSANADGTLSRIDTASGQVTNTYWIGGSPAAIRYAAGLLWVAIS